jgi:ribosomal protein L35
MNKYNQTEKGKAAAKRYRQSKKGKFAQKRAIASFRKKAKEFKRQMQII